MIDRLQEAVAQRPELQGGMLILDESGEEKSGEMTVGVGRQYNGRHRQVERCQVGVYLTYSQGSVWTWVDGEVYVPQDWFTPAASQRRAQVGLPAERVFQTKPALGWQMIQRAQAAGLPFAAVAFDSIYGREDWLRDHCQAAAIEYYADVPSNSQLYLRDPSAAFVPNSKGRIPQNPTILVQWAYAAREIAQDQETEWQTIEIRPDDRGILTADFAVRPVWTLRDGGRVVEERLLLRRDGTHITYTLTNAPARTPLRLLAQRKSQRYFIERSIQEAKSDLGWDEFQAVKYRAWQHHLALTLLASWFIAETRLDWQAEHPRNPALLEHYDTDLLPALSLANVRELLRAAFPLPQLSPQQAARLVVQHLDNRTRSRRSRLRRRLKP
jgi:SRSO17 transposase